MKGFEPAKHLTTVSGRDYLEVKWRLVWLRAEQPLASIETELHSLADGTAIFRARVRTPEGAEASGWGSESAADFPDFIEKAETKALGRALAALGYGVQFCEDFDYDGDRRRAADGDRSSGRATDAQVRAIYAIGHGAGLARDEVDQRCRSAHASRVPSELTRREASEYIDALKAEAGTTRQAVAAG